jgi:ArsR family transcriptional regulator, arsenate/arsenite/antimonite-responsive transcriptional repressor
MKSDTVVRALGALAHESRLAIFQALVVAGPEGLAAGDIAQQLGVSPSGLSFHLKDLSRAGLVNARQDGRFIFYSANSDTMSGLIGFLSEHCCEGGKCLVKAVSKRSRKTPLV